MSELICPLCGKPNPPELDECKFCQAPLKTAGFLAPAEPVGKEQQPQQPPEEPIDAENKAGQLDSVSPLEQAIPDWLRETEASFLEPVENETGESTSDAVSKQIDDLLNQAPAGNGERGPAIDDDWLASLLAEAGLNEPSPQTPQERVEDRSDFGEDAEAFSDWEEEELPVPTEQIEKPDWLSDLEAGSTLKLEEEPPIEELGGKPSEPSEGQKKKVEAEIPDWVSMPIPEEPQPAEEEPETPIAPAELPSWLEAMRPPDEELTASGPVEDLSAADVVTAGPLAGLRGVLSPHPSALRPRKPPTYSIKLRVTDEQRERVQMMEELLAEEQKPKPLPSPHRVNPRNISRVIIAVILILPILGMIISKSQQVSPPQSSVAPGVLDFTQQIQRLPIGAPVLLGFDYEAGFSGELNPAISALVSQLMAKGSFMALVTTIPSGPALAESMMVSANTAQSNQAQAAPYTYYTNLGYIPGGTMGLLGLAISPRTILPYSLNTDNVWATAPLNSITSIKDFSAVILLTNDPNTARSWIEQVGPLLREAQKPLLVITSAQAEPLIRPYYEAVPSQVQGMIAGFSGGVAYARITGNPTQNGLWDAYSLGITVSVLVIIVGTLIGVIAKMPADRKRTDH